MQFYLILEECLIDGCRAEVESSVGFRDVIDDHLPLLSKFKPLQEHYRPGPSNPTRPVELGIRILGVQSLIARQHRIRPVGSVNCIRAQK